MEGEGLRPPQTSGSGRRAEQDRRDVLDLLRRVARRSDRNRGLQWLTDGLAFGLLLALLFSFLAPPPALVVAALLLPVISLAVAFLFGRSTPLRRAAAVADRRAELADELKSAVHLLADEPAAGSFEALHLQRAATTARALDPRALVPLARPARLAAAPALALALLLALGLGWRTSSPAPAPPSPESGVTDPATARPHPTLRRMADGPEGSPPFQPELRLLVLPEQEPSGPPSVEAGGSLEDGSGERTGAEPSPNGTDPPADGSPADPARQATDAAQENPPPPEAGRQASAAAAEAAEGEAGAGAEGEPLQRPAENSTGPLFADAQPMPADAMTAEAMDGDALPPQSGATGPQAGESQPLGELTTDLALELELALASLELEASREPEGDEKTMASPAAEARTRRFQLPLSDSWEKESAQPLSSVPWAHRELTRAYFLQRARQSTEGGR